MEINLLSGLPTSFESIMGDCGSGRRTHRVHGSGACHATDLSYASVWVIFCSWTIVDLVCPGGSAPGSTPI